MSADTKPTDFLVSGEAQYRIKNNGLISVASIKSSLTEAEKAGDTAAVKTLRELYNDHA